MAPKAVVALICAATLAGMYLTYSGSIASVMMAVPPAADRDVGDMADGKPAHLHLAAGFHHQSGSVGSERDQQHKTGASR